MLMGLWLPRRKVSCTAMSNLLRLFPPGAKIDAAPSRPQQILMTFLRLLVFTLAVGLPAGARPKS